MRCLVVVAVLLAACSRKAPTARDRPGVRATPEAGKPPEAPKEPDDPAELLRLRGPLEGGVKAWLAGGDVAAALGPVHLGQVAPLPGALTGTLVPELFSVDAALYVWPWGNETRRIDLRFRLAPQVTLLALASATPADGEHLRADDRFDFRDTAQGFRAVVQSLLASAAGGRCPRPSFAADDALAALPPAVHDRLSADLATARRAGAAACGELTRVAADRSASVMVRPGKVRFLLRDAGGAVQGVLVGSLALLREHGEPLALSLDGLE